MNIEDINKSTWFTKRYVEHVPCHFVTASTPVDDENLAWVYQKTHGRFSIVQPTDDRYRNDETYFYNIKVYAFEDPKEAVQFELTWS